MADYKRFVSYMYEYENGVKKKNVGYVRVEIRNGECKFTISMRMQGLADGIFPTYLIHRPTNEMELIYLGDSVAKNQIMNSRLNATETNIMKSGYDFSNVGGMLLFLNSGVFYATEWDDKAVVLEEVLEALKPNPKKKDNIDIINKPDKLENGEVVQGNKEEISTIRVEKEKLDKDQAADDMKLDRIQVADDKKIDKVIRADNEASDSFVKSDKEKLDSIINADKKRLESIVRADRDKLDRTNREDKEKLDGRASVDNKPIYMLPGGWRTSQKYSPNQSKAPVNPWDLVEKYKANELKNVQKINVAQRENEDKNIEDKEADLKMVKSESRKESTPNKAEKLFNSYPRIYPFEDNMISKCVKIEPKDIGSLPSEVWSLSNNSFLLHGYYCYNHLILAEIKDRYGCHYILGVPGIYHNRERFMARMFGFECFKPIRRRDLRQGDFGYWYLQIKLD